MDVESLPDEDFYYLIGLRVKAAGRVVQHSYWADTVEDERTLWENFLDTLSKIENPTLIHYGSFETKFFKKMRELYGYPLEGSAVAKTIESSVNLLSLIFAQIYFPTFSNGLKDIARYLGFQWTDAQASGAQAIAWRHEWVNSRSSSIKQALIIYNSQDCEALELLTKKVAELVCPSNVITTRSHGDFVHSDQLKREHLYGFGRNTFALPEMDEINQAAYWDYQRERIYVKTNTRLKRSMKSPFGARRCVTIAIPSRKP